MSKFTIDEGTLDQPVEASESLEEQARRAVENASTQELLELIRFKHAMQTDLVTAVAALGAAKGRRSH